MENEQLVGASPAVLPSFRALLRDAWELYKKKLSVLVGIVGIPVLLGIVGALLQAGNAHFLGALFTIAAIICWLFASVALIYSIHREETVQAAYRFARSRVLSYLWIVILVSLVDIGAFFLFIIPGIILSVSLSFVAFVLVLEDQRGMNALLRSREYVKGRWWKVVFRIALVAIVIALVSMIIGAIAGAGGKIFASVVSSALQLFIAPFYVSYLYLLFRALQGTRPEFQGVPPKGKKGFFIFSAIFGIVMTIVTIIAAIVLAAVFVIGKSHAPSIFSMFQKIKTYQVLRDRCAPGDDCCIRSADEMLGKGYTIAEQGVCSSGFHVNSLRCETSYQWCEPGTSEGAL